MEHSIAQKILLLLGNRRQSLACAESCTGGLVSASITEIPGSSANFHGGFVTYSNEAKSSLLGIPANLIQEHGPVSERVAKLMAESCKERLGADWGLSTTGIAGPGGGSAQNPVGTVWFAITGPQGTQTMKKLFPGDRNQVRQQSVQYLLNAFLHTLETVQNITCSFEQ